MFTCSLLSFSIATLALAPSQEPSRHVPLDDRAPCLPLVLDGIVLEPDGTPAAGAVVVSSSGGESVARADGSFSLEVEVPLDAESLEVSASTGEGEHVRTARVSVHVSAATGITHTEPLLLAPPPSCEPRWLKTFGGLPGVDGKVLALATFDDGRGPALYVGGTFVRAGDVVANRIARWDGERWSTLGTGMDDTVNELAVLDDGSGPALYAAGSFTSAGGTSAHAIAKWNGASWSALGTVGNC